VGNGHIVPAVETLEKFARVFKVPMYQLFYYGEEPPKLPKLPRRKATDDILWGNSGNDARMLGQFCRLFSRMEKGKPELLLFAAKKMTKRKVV
jgi:hypothetical protein